MQSASELSHNHLSPMKILTDLRKFFANEMAQFRIEKNTSNRNGSKGKRRLDVAATANEIVTGRHELLIFPFISNLP